MKVDNSCKFHYVKVADVGWGIITCWIEVVHDSKPWPASTTTSPANKDRIGQQINAIQIHGGELTWYITEIITCQAGIPCQFHHSHTQSFHGDALNFVSGIIPECRHLEDPAQTSSRQRLQGVVIRAMQRITYYSRYNEGLEDKFCELTNRVGV